MASGRIVFFGTSEAGIPFLEMLKTHFELPLIITQPDAVGGRCRQRICPPVKSFAERHNLPMEQPERLKDHPVADRIARLKPDIGVVIGYGQLIPKKIFQLPRFNTVNVHFSLLPRYRGAAPVQRALENGETRTGITVFEIIRKMDAGPIWCQKSVDIHPGDRADTLMNRLSETGAPFLKGCLETILRGDGSPRPQDDSRASYAPPIQKQEGRVDWTQPASRIINRYRAFTPWPGLFFQLNDRTVKITKLSLTENPTPGGADCVGPGDIRALSRDHLEVCCGDRTTLKIEEFQPAGKKPMTPYCFSLGNPLPRKLN